MKKIHPCLWFDDRIEEAVTFYVKTFKDGKILSTSRYGEHGPMQAGKVMVMNFEIQGQAFMALNGGPQFKFTEAVSFVVPCENQAEVDYYWNTLTVDGGAESMCGWCKDKFGLSWQIVPTALERLMSGGDKAKSERVMQALLGMRKLDIAGLERAAQG